jgi:hypothetical protein
MTEPQIFDLTLRFVPGYGWLYLIVIDGREEARGEFKPSANDALVRGLAMMERIAGQVSP